jgi:nucleotide-binding universal stress UspA family protein
MNAEPARLLIATGEAASDLSEIPSGARLLIDAATEVLVVVPALPSRIAWLASDTDKTREIADRRLRVVVDQVADEETKTEGVVGADDPMLAFEDAIADFQPDHILIGVRGRGQSGWQERGLVDKVLERFGLPVTVFRFPD